MFFTTLLKIKVDFEFQIAIKWNAIKRFLRPVYEYTIDVLL